MGVRKCGWTALHWAAHRGLERQVRLLIEAGADVSTLEKVLGI